MRKWLLLAAVACLGTACTPVRSTLAPPYDIDGRELDAGQMNEYANSACSEASPTLPPNKFTTDGCSAYPDAHWVTCCIKHDVAYWCGAGVRREADRAFRQCVRDAGSRVNAAVMYGGVRIGGGRFAPFPWRFGYGYAWPHRPGPKRNGVVPAPSADVTSSEPLPQIPLTSP